MSPEERTVIRHLIELTLSREKREALRDAIGAIKERHGAEAAKTELKTKYGISTAPMQTVDLGIKYCDRLYSSVDNWDDEYDRERWIDVCQIVTEVTSSTVM